MGKRIEFDVIPAGQYHNALREFMKYKRFIKLV
jgi:hypothetical protein